MSAPSPGYARPTRLSSVRLAGPLVVLALVAAACSSSSKAPSSTLAPATLNGSGSTFQQAFDQDQIAAFTASHPGITINYAGGGSGKGRQNLADQVVDFAGSDVPIPAADVSKFKGGPVLYFPTVVAPVTVSYHLSGVTTLVLSADTIAKIFSRSVTTWNDAAIMADNPSATLPATPITVAHRSDGSGTTQNFTKYLKEAAPASWTLGSGSTVTWPSGTQAGNGNSGVAQIVKSTDGAIGYVDFSDAKAAGLSFASVKTSSGAVVAPSVASAQAALAGVAVKPDLTFDPINSSAPGAYPITSPTWILVYKNQTDKAKGAALKSFLAFLLSNGQQTAKNSDFGSLVGDLGVRALYQVSQIVVPA